jgi:uncharacterized protein YukE
MMRLGPDGGPSILVQVEPQDFHDVAQKFADAQGTIYDVLPTLFKVLDGYPGVAGIDDSAKNFNTQYQPAVGALVTGVNRAVNLLNDISWGIEMSACNHWNADAASNPGGGQPPPWPTFNPGLYLPQNLATPSLVGNSVSAFPPPLSDKVPDGHVHLLQAIAQAFRGARDTISNTSTGLHDSLAFLFSNNQSRDLNDFNDFWNKVGGNSDTAILTALQSTCDQIANAVNDYAD